MKLKIYFSNEQNKIKISFKIRHLIKKSVKEALTEEGFSYPAEVSVSFVDNETIHKLLIILQNDLANKENALNAAIQVLNSQQAALASKTEEIEDMVGMKTEIIAELSSSLARANLSAAVDKNSGDIVLDSAVFFDTASFSIKET